MVAWYTPEELITDGPYESSAGTLVHERFDTSHNYATDLQAKVEEWLDLLVANDYVIEWTPYIWTDVPSPGIDGINPYNPPAPPLDPIEIVIEPFTKQDPEFPDIDISIDPRPDFNPTDPGFEIPPAPIVDWITFGGEAPVPTDIELPPPPLYVIPPIPSVTDPSIPSPPDLNMPSFEGADPGDFTTLPPAPPTL